MTRIPGHLGFERDISEIQSTMKIRLPVVYTSEIVEESGQPEYKITIGHDAGLEDEPLVLKIDTARLNKEQVVSALREIVDAIETEGLQVNTYENDKHGFAIMDRGPNRRAESGTSW